MQIIQFTVRTLYQVILQTRSQQLTQIVFGCSLDTIIGADGLPLHSHLNLIAFYGPAMRGVEKIGVTTTSGGRTTAPVEEYDFHALLPRHRGDVFFRRIDRPVGHQVTTVLGTVGEAKHYRLTLTPLSQVCLIGFSPIETLHGGATMLKIIDRFKQGHDIYRDGLIAPSTQTEQRQYARHIDGPPAITDDISMSTALTVAELDMTNHLK